MSTNTDANSKDIADVWDEHLKCEFEIPDVNQWLPLSTASGVNSYSIGCLTLIISANLPTKE